MKLYELSVGTNFEFDSKHRNKIFQIKEKTSHSIIYVDLGTNEERNAYSHRKAFRYDVSLIVKEKSIVITDEEKNLLVEILHDAYKLSAERCDPEVRRMIIDRIYKKVKN